MKTYQKPYTEKFPFQYSIESEFYVVHTCNKQAYERAWNQVIEKGITEFNITQINTLAMAGFTIIRKK